jgi:hypothetical protein
LNSSRSCSKRPNRRQNRRGLMRSVPIDECPVQMGAMLSKLAAAADDPLTV